MSAFVDEAQLNVRGGEMIEEELASGQQIVGDLEIVENLLLGDAAHAVFRAGRIAELRR